MSTLSCTLLLVLLSALGLGCSRSTSVPSEIKDPAKLDANTLAADQEVRVEYYFDRNALANSIKIRDALLAQTRSGNLLRIGLETMRIQAERFYQEPVVTVASGLEDRAYAALEDGTILEVEPNSLDGRLIARLPGIPLWLAFSRKRGSLVAVVSKPGEGLVVHELKSGRSVVLPTDFMQGVDAGHFRLDGNGRLWIGIDEGEWGGRMAVLDLDTGIARQVPHTAHDGVYGFAELPDQTVLAYGGISHVGSWSAFVSVVNQSPAKTLYSAASHSSDVNRQRREKERPLAPISHLVVETPRSLLLLSGNNLYRSDRSLAHFERIASLPARGLSGRPDALGDYPAVSGVYSLGAGAFLCVTVRDGLIKGEAATLSSHALGGQLDIPAIYVILPGSPGVVLLDSTWQPTALRRSAGGWEPVLGQVAQHDPDEPEFTTPDGSHWRVSSHVLQRLQNGVWRSEGKAPDTSRMLKPIHGPGPPWVLLDSLSSQLLLLSTETLKGASALQRVALQEEVTDAIRLDPDRLLVATAKGLQILNPRTAELKPQGGNQDVIYSLGRDGLGRVWLGGKGLWISRSPTELLPLRSVHSPALPNRGIVAIAADPDHPDGILAAMGRYGLVAVQMPARGLSR